MPELHLLNLQAPTLKWGDWFMKLKIFIGFSQCFCYFPVIFDVQWPENLLRWMNWLEFTSIDMYAVFGNVSCRLQTDFLQKFVFHMSLFPLLLPCCDLQESGLPFTWARCFGSAGATPREPLPLSLGFSSSSFLFSHTRLFPPLRPAPFSERSASPTSWQRTWRV